MLNTKSDQNTHQIVYIYNLNMVKQNIYNEAKKITKIQQIYKEQEAMKL